MGRLDGKVCVITGAGGGMGREAAILFTEEGAQVCVADVNLEAARRDRRELPRRVRAQVDVADETSVKAMMTATAERYGGIDVLYNNAGISPNDDARCSTRRRRVGPRASRQHEGRLPLLQARHPASAAARRRLA